MSETIQHFIDSGDTLEAWCNSCRHSNLVDVLKLRDRLGPDHGSLHDDIVHLFRCSECQSKDIGFIRHAKGNENRRPGGAHSGSNMYAKAKGG